MEFPEPGVYDIVYRVVDSFGGETTKAIVVTITEREPEEEVVPTQEDTTCDAALLPIRAVYLPVWILA